MSKLHKRYLFIAILLLSLLSYAEDRTFRFTHLSMDDGLSHNDITSILQDSDGFMWFATRDGLNRYDGNRVKVYRHRYGNDSQLDKDYILSLCLDNHGTVWIGTRGVARYDACGDSLTYFTQKTVEGATPVGLVSSVKAGSDGNVFFLENGQGVYHYNTLSGDYHFYPFQISEDNKKTISTVNAMWVDDNNRVWLGGDMGIIFLLDPSSGKYHAIKMDCVHADNDRLQVITGNEHFIYLGFQYSGVIRYSLDKKSFSVLPLTRETDNLIFVHDILIDENLLWIATEQGLLIFDETTKQTTYVKRDYFDPLSLSDNAVYAVYKDRDNGMWVGTYFGGVNYMSLDLSRFTESYYPLQSKNSLKGKAVREICQDERGHVWIGTEDAGLNCFDPQTKTILPVNVQLDHYNVHGMEVIGDELYIGVFSGGLNIYNLQTGKTSHYYISDDRYNVDNSIYAICHDSKKRIWICTQSGVYWFHRQTGNFQLVEGLEGIYVHNICEDSAGNIWLATMGKSLMCYTANGKVECYQDFLLKSLGRIITRILSVYEDKEKRLWIGTSGNGLICYSPGSKLVIHYSIDTGLPDNTAYQAIQDILGDVWVGTNRGLVRISPSTGNIRVFTKSDGLLSNQFNYNSAFCDSYGRLYFGTISGLSVIDPSGIKDNLSFPPVFLTGFQLYNKEVFPGGNSPLKQSITRTQVLELDYNQNFIGFDYAVLRYGVSQRNMCYVKLEGVDKDWVLVSDMPHISYSNLHPGIYRLAIKSSNSVGEWKEVYSLPIHILPPWWKTLWAYVAYCIVFLLALVGIFLYVRQRLMQRQNLLVKQVEEKKERESYRAKIEFFTNIAHEIKTPLTLIKGPLENIMCNKPFDEETKESLNMVMKNTDRLLSLTYQLLDFRQVETNQMHLNFEQTDVGLLLQAIYYRFRLSAEHQGVSFELLLPDIVILADVDVEALTKIISNLFTNASNYSSSCINVVLSIEDEGFFCIMVENDGDLIEHTLAEKIFEPFFQISSSKQVNAGRGLGLPLARSLAQLHGVDLCLDVTRSDMNSFVLRLPLTHNIKKQEFDKIEVSDTNDERLATILVVEDNLEMLEFVSKKLMERYTVYRAMDGIEALKVLNEQEIDLVVSDVMMPNMDGMELLRTIKTQVGYSHIPVVLLTAKSNLQTKIEGLELGADAYIEKPFSLEHLQVKISSLLKNRKLVKSLYRDKPLTQAKVMALTKADELFLQKVNHVIEENLNNLQFGVDLLAEKMSMSRSSLHRKLKGVADLTPNDYIRLQRLKKAAQFLQEGTYRVNEIAFITGFTSPSYFAKCFQQHFGILPKNFAKEQNP